jgi:hypothetical protein
MALTRAIQISSRVMWWDTRGKVKYGSVKAINILSDVRFTTDLLPHPNFLFIFQLDVSSRCDSSGGWSTTISNASVRNVNALNF